MSDLDVVLAPVRILPAFETEIKHFIQQALDKVPPRNTADTVYNNAVNDDCQVFLAIDSKAVIKAVCITTIHQYDLAKVMCVEQLGSDVTMDELQPLFERVESWAQANDCNYTEIYGRKGWVKLLENYKDTGTHLVHYY